MISPLVAIGALVVLTPVAESFSITELFASYNKPTRSDSYKKQDYIQDSFKKDDRYEKDDRHEEDGHHENKHESIEDNKHDHDYKMKEQVTFARTYKHEPQHYEEEDYKNDGKQESHEDHKEHVAYDRTYKHEPRYYDKEYYRHIHEEYEEPKYDHRGGYRPKTMKSHEPTYRLKRRSVRYGGDSYGKSYSSYSSYKPYPYRRNKRSAGFNAREERVLARWEAIY